MEIAIDFPSIIPKSVALQSIPGTTDNIHALHITLFLMAYRLKYTLGKSKEHLKHILIPG